MFCLPTTHHEALNSRIVHYMNSSTGLGQWQTVTVRSVDEAEELRRQKQREKEERDNQAARKKVHSVMTTIVVTRSQCVFDAIGMLRGSGCAIAYMLYYQSTWL